MNIEGNKKSKIYLFFYDKIKKTKYVSIAFLFIGALLVFFLFFKDGLAEKIKVEQQSKYKIYEQTIGLGETFSSLASSLNLAVEKMNKILKISENVHSLADIRAGHIIKTFFDETTNQFKKLEYQINENNLLIIIADDQKGVLLAEKKEIEYEVELKKVSGVIEKSLYQTGQSLGLPDKIIIEMADIFAWDIDFGFDIKVGDNFDVIYEKRFLNGEEAKPGKILMARFNNQGHDSWAIFYQDIGGRSDYYDLDGHCLRRQFLRAPLQYKYISSGFTYRRLHPVLGRYTQHTAIDYAAPTGTPVSATGGGTVTYVGWQGGVGMTVVIRHNEIYSTRYSHLSAYGKGIKIGAKVAQGQIIGYVGSTGHLSTGPHLEYAMNRYGTPINPLTQNFDQVEPLLEIYREDFNLKKEELLKKIN